MTENPKLNSIKVQIAALEEFIFNKGSLQRVRSVCCGEAKGNCDACILSRAKHCYAYKPFTCTTVSGKAYNVCAIKKPENDHESHKYLKELRRALKRQLLYEILIIPSEEVSVLLLRECPKYGATTDILTSREAESIIIEIILLKLRALKSKLHEKDNITRDFIDDIMKDISELNTIIFDDMSRVVANDLLKDHIKHDLFGNLHKLVSQLKNMHLNNVEYDSQAYKYVIRRIIRQVEGIISYFDKDYKSTQEK